MSFLLLTCGNKHTISLSVTSISTTSGRYFVSLSTCRTPLYLIEGKVGLPAIAVEFDGFPTLGLYGGLSILFALFPIS